MCAVCNSRWPALPRCRPNAARAAALPTRRSPRCRAADPTPPALPTRRGRTSQGSLARAAALPTRRSPRCRAADPTPPALPRPISQRVKKLLHPVREYQQPVKGQPGSQSTSEKRDEANRLKTGIRFLDFDTVHEYIKSSPSCNTKYWHQEIASNANRQLTSNIPSIHSDSQSAYLNHCTCFTNCCKEIPRQLLP